MLTVHKNSKQENRILGKKKKNILYVASVKNNWLFYFQMSVSINYYCRFNGESIRPVEKTGKQISKSDNSKKSSKNSFFRSKTMASSLEIFFCSWFLVFLSSLSSLIYWRTDVLDKIARIWVCIIYNGSLPLWESRCPFDHPESPWIP